MKTLVPLLNRLKSKKVGHQNSTVIYVRHFKGDFVLTELNESAKSVYQKYAHITMLSFVNTVMSMLTYSAYFLCLSDITSLNVKSVHKMTVL